MGMQDIKRRIKSVTSIEHITNAMKLVSAAKLQRAKLTLERTQRCLSYVSDSIDGIASGMAELPGRYLPKNGGAGRTCFVLITSNRGLAGSFNANAIKQAEADIAAARAKAEAESAAAEAGGAKGAHPHGVHGAAEAPDAGGAVGAEAAEGPVFVCIGGRGRDYFAKRGYGILAAHRESPEAISFAEAAAMVRPVIEMYDKGEIGEVRLVHTSFVTMLEQRVVSKRLLPFEPAAHKAVGAADAAGEPGMGDSAGGPGKAGAAAGEPGAAGGRRGEGLTEYGPSPEAVFDYLIPKHVEIAVYGAIIESAACEHAARRMAMENATDNAREMIADLGLFYNRARQAAITKEITEIVSGSEAING